MNLLRVTTLAFVAAALAGCGGAGADGRSPGPATGAGATGVSGSPVPSPTAASKQSATLAPGDLAAAKRVVRRLIAAVDDDRFALARSLMTDPDSWWSLDDMKSIQSIRLQRIQLMSVEGPDAVLLQTLLTRTPPPMAGGDSWPNFMTLRRDGPGGQWRVAATASGP